MRVLAVTHGASVGPEIFSDVIAEDGHELVEWEIATRGAPPAGFDAVLVFGGDQNVGEEVEHPWLHEEYGALRTWAGDGTPLLAVCLGAQTLAHALEAQVQRVGSQLAGFYATELTDEGVAVRNRQMDLVVFWTAIRSIKLTESRIFLFMTRRSALIVPQRAFQTEAQFQAFATAAQDYWRKGHRS